MLNTNEKTESREGGRFYREKERFELGFWPLEVPGRVGDGGGQPDG